MSARLKLKRGLKATPYCLLSILLKNISSVRSNLTYKKEIPTWIFLREMKVNYSLTIWLFKVSFTCRAKEKIDPNTWNSPRIDHKIRPRFWKEGREYFRNCPAVSFIPILNENHLHQASFSALHFTTGNFSLKSFRSGSHRFLENIKWRLYLPPPEIWVSYRKEDSIGREDIKKKKGP